MSISFPSQQIHAIDVPEVKNFNVKFVYNYFVPDEMVNEEVKIPDFVAFKSTGEISSNYEKKFDSIVPRYNKLEWKKTIATANADVVSNINSTFDQQKIPKDFIRNNYSRIISEDQFSSENFVGVLFQDSELFTKLYTILKSLKTVTGDVPNDDLDYSSILNDPSTFNTSYGTATGARINDSLGSIGINVQINNRFLYDISKKILQDPNSPFTDEVYPLLDYGKSYKDMVSDKISIEEYAPDLPYVSEDPSSGSELIYDIKVVGYVIEKFSVDENRNLISHDPIIIEDDSIQNYFDTKIKYGITYCYTIKSICAVKVPALNKSDDSTNKGSFSLVTFLISSKTSNRIWTQSIEKKAPPYPADTAFMWDYAKENLIITWCMPVNPQMDIKKFQVFRRKKIEHAFQILKEYDFDDSVIKTNYKELVITQNYEKSNYPICYYIDEEFNKDSKFIYTLASVDAHGITSNYGPQFEVSFDKFKNELVEKLVSYPGAPKPYPNLYMQGTGFTNTMKVNGIYSRNMSIYLAPHEFNKRYFFLKKGGLINNVQPAFETDLTGGSYKLQILNLDNQKGETITINVSDYMTPYQQAKDSNSGNNGNNGASNPLKILSLNKIYKYI